MSNKAKTIEETIELLKQGRPLRYFYMTGGVAFSPVDNETPYISIGDFLKMRADGIIDCDAGVKKCDTLGSRQYYQEYTLVNKHPVILSEKEFQSE